MVGFFYIVMLSSSDVRVVLAVILAVTEHLGLVAKNRNREHQQTENDCTADGDTDAIHRQGDEQHHHRDRTIADRKGLGILGAVVLVAVVHVFGDGLVLGDHHDAIGDSEADLDCTIDAEVDHADAGNERNERIGHEKVCNIRSDSRKSNCEKPVHKEFLSGKKRGKGKEVCLNTSNLAIYKGFFKG